MVSTLEDLSEFERGIIECISASSHIEGQCARNSILHLEKAHTISKIDKEMSVFRAITAEEEAASAVFYSLKILGYKNSKKINPRNHVHKNALNPFLISVNNFISSIREPPFKVSLVIKEIESIKRLSIVLGLPNGLNAEPQPPFNFSISDINEKRRKYFEDEFIKLTIEKGAREIESFIQNAANQRNLVLYASENGISSVDSDIGETLNLYKRRVFTILIVYCLIFPYKENAEFVQQVLDSFLVAIGAIKRSNLSW